MLLIDLFIIKVIGIKYMLSLSETLNILKCRLANNNYKEYKRYPLLFKIYKNDIFIIRCRRLI